MTVVLVIASLLGLFMILIYNKMVSGRNAVKAGFANIDVELKRRFDLIPNLVQTAKKYMDHEATTLQTVIAARNEALNVVSAIQKDPFKQGAFESMTMSEAKLAESLTSFKVVSEKYPALKADGIMTKLMGELSDTENRISFMRQNYNDIVMSYNSSLEVFPNLYFARIFNFTPGQPWQIENGEEREVVKVEF